LRGPDYPFMWLLDKFVTPMAGGLKRLKPHLSRTFKVSNDPELTEKLEGIVGLYLNPPEHAIVLCA
jgi:hypothetical protein